ncbi:MAG: histidine phosphatase family protein [Chloroflexi bacterium]|nr:histidine phosphatase family protein [Chloroflexota bacterium]
MGQSTTRCRLFLVRHGQAEVPGSVYCGQLDPPLSALGREQAKRLQSRLQGEEFEAVFSSDLTRAVQTAGIVVAGRGVEIVKMPELRELSFGEWEGLSFGDIESKHPDQLQRWIADPVGSYPPGGESLRALDDRVRSALDRVMSSGLSPVLVVTHGGPLRSLAGNALGVPLLQQWVMEFDRGGFSVMDRRDGVWSIRVLNDTCHLRGREKRWLEAPAG